MANGWNDPRLKVIDLKWAALDPADSIFTKLEPRTERVVSAADIARATTEPPEDTRAWLRAKLVAQFGDEVAAASWSRLILPSIQPPQPCSTAPSIMVWAAMPSSVALFLPNSWSQRMTI